MPMKTKSRPKAAKKQNYGADYNTGVFPIKPSRAQRKQRRGWLRGARR